MDWIEELKATLKKIRECEENALRRFLACKSDSAARWATPLLIDGNGSDFYNGECVAYRNSGHYIECLLKTAGVDPSSVSIGPQKNLTDILAEQKKRV